MPLQLPVHLLAAGKLAVVRHFFACLEIHYLAFQGLKKG